MFGAGRRLRKGSTGVNAIEDRQEFFDRVYACWMGKNIGGTLGGPLEGRLELMDIKGYTQQFVGAVENDDLDLQLVNLHCVEQYGGRADMNLLSREWLDHVHFQWDEYGHSLTNMRRGLGAPLSGCFNNFFTDCMGSPIRSEIWAVLCAGMPDLAAYYAYNDASVDHAGGEGVYGEIFFAVLESMAFVETDKFRLIDRALGYLPADCAVRRAVELLLERYHAGATWVEARQAIIDGFAGDNFTYAPVNIAFTLVGWLYEEGFTAQMLTTIDCGYDTDCTVATLGSLLGILYGTKYLDSYWTQPLGDKIVVSRPVTGFNAPRTITELTQRSIAARELVQAHYAQQADKSVYAIPYQSAVEAYRLPLGSHKLNDVDVELRHQDGEPAFAPGETRRLYIRFRNHEDIAQSFEVSADVPGFASDSARVELPGVGEAECALTLTAPADKHPLYQGRLLIKRYVGGLYWNTETLPLTLLPTMDWRVRVDGAERAVHTAVNRLSAAALGIEGAHELTFSTRVTLAEEPRETWLKLVCRNPLRVTLDGETIIDTPDTTVVIPAYHRADKRKCARVRLAPGAHELTVTVGDAQSFSEMYFMLVHEELWWAYRIDSMFE